MEHYLFTKLREGYIYINNETVAPGMDMWHLLRHGK